MLQVVSLVFEGVEGFIFHLPPGSSPAHDEIDVLFGESEIRDPGEVLLAVVPYLPIFEKIDADVLIRFVERNIVEEPEEVAHAGLGVIGHIVYESQSVFDSCGPGVEEVLVILLLNPENEVATVCFKIPDMGTIGTESVLCRISHDDS